ncbi:glycosyltransferase family 2 protein [Bifidobacterium pullorum]|uniref:glycosyltransferase family 2 protein n=1 Tax=Bifidobacterium pullorum TaxID=78448 RepID=UPI002B27B09A|nr:glycosyltransferase family 2 protein [Bifidobacterium pullorum]
MEVTQERRGPEPHTPPREHNPLVSFVVPCFNEQESLPLFYEEATRVARTLLDRYGTRAEFVFVDDGSSDATLDELRRLHEQDPRVRYVSFSRNFGKESALYAGLRTARGDYVATLDADLQDPPSLLPQMLGFLAEHPDYDCVATRRETRAGEPPVRSFFSRLFYRIINRLSGTHIVDGARDFRLMTRTFVDAVLSMSEVNRFSKGLFSWVGFKTHWISYENVERVAGKTKWNFRGLFRYSIEGIVGFSTVPLMFAAFLGIACCLVSFISIVFIIVRALLYGDPVAGWPSTICIILLIGGLQLFCTGILGEYLAKTYTETKHRPIYLTKETETSRHTRTDILPTDQESHR